MTVLDGNQSSNQPMARCHACSPRNLPVQDRCQDQRAEANEISRDNGIRKDYLLRFVGGIEQQMVLLHNQWRTEPEH